MTVVDLSALPELAREEARLRWNLRPDPRTRAVAEQLWKDGQGTQTQICRRLAVAQWCLRKAETRLVQKIDAVGLWTLASGAVRVRELKPYRCFDCQHMELEANDYEPHWVICRKHHFGSEVLESPRDLAQCLRKAETCPDYTRERS